MAFRSLFPLSPSRYRLQLTTDLGVGGSNPSGRATIFNKLRVARLRCCRIVATGCFEMPGLGGLRFLIVAHVPAQQLSHRLAVTTWD
jgi:hypothetical protein